MPHEYKRNPLLTDADIRIGGAFVYREQIWYRTNRSAATTFSGGRANACFFEYHENGGDVEINEIRKIDMDKLNALIQQNSDELLLPTQRSDEEHRVLLGRLAVAAKKELDKMLLAMGMEKPDDYNAIIAFMIEDVFPAPGEQDPDDDAFASAFRQWTAQSKRKDGEYHGKYPAN